MKEHHDRSCRKALQPLHPGQHVTVWNKDKKTWHPAIVHEKCPEPRSYIVQTPNGNKIRRSRIHLRGPYNARVQETVKRTYIEPCLPEDQEGHCNESQDVSRYEDKPKAPDLDITTEPVRTRFGRTVVKPAHYKDYV